MQPGLGTATAYAGDHCTKRANTNKYTANIFSRNENALPHALSVENSSGLPINNSFSSDNDIGSQREDRDLPHRTSLSLLNEIQDTASEQIVPLSTSEYKDLFPGGSGMQILGSPS